jgi:centractin
MKGSGYMKVGFSGDEKKPEKFPTMYQFIRSCRVGRPKYNVVIPSTSNQMETYIGKELEESKRGLYKLRYPMKHGVIENWDDM